MTYVPTDAEKNAACVIQALSVLFFMIPAWIAGRLAVGQSPYVRFWAKANGIWSLRMAVLVILVGGVAMSTGFPGLLVAAWAIHAIMVILGAFAAMFNRPLSYFHIAERRCTREMAAIYGAALRTNSAE